MSYHRIFVPYKGNDRLYEVGEGGLDFVKMEVWDWLREHFGPGQLIGARWQVNPDTQFMNEHYKHGREFLFIKPDDAMLFKLTWL